MMMRPWCAALAALALGAPAVGAQTADWRAPALAAAAEALEAQYVSADKGAKLAAFLRGRAGAYAEVTDKAEFARKVTTDLYGQVSDKHLVLRYEPAPTAAGAPPPAQYACMGAKIEHRRLDGNVGLITLPRLAGDRDYMGGFDAAMGDLGDARALILDLRGNCGGAAPFVRHVSTYFFDKPTLIAATETRAAGVEERWTFEETPHPRYLGRPVYILIDRVTISAGESFAFGMSKVTGRAKLVGERTAGGGHFGASRRVSPDFMLFVPVGRTFDPKTGKGWEIDGLEPDIPATSDAALQAALSDLG